MATESSFMGQMVSLNQFLLQNSFSEDESFASPLMLSGVKIGIPVLRANWSLYQTKSCSPFCTDRSVRTVTCLHPLVSLSQKASTFCSCLSLAGWTCRNQLLLPSEVIIFPLV